MIRLRHARVELALHALAQRDGPTLLLLHALGADGRSWGTLTSAWPGRVVALDFSGHGASQWVRGGAYTPELLAGDADAALAAIGPAVLAGAGVGAYVALLLAGARAAQVPAALLLPGAGLSGGGPEPDWDRPVLRALTPAAHPPLPAGCDPLCCALLADPRPPDYAARFAAAARRLVLLDDDAPRPPWWNAVSASPTAEVADDLDAALERLRVSASPR